VAVFVSAKIEAFLVQPALPILPFFGLIEIDVNKRASVLFIHCFKAKTNKQHN
jgi:hypothetical protein